MPQQATPARSICWPVLLSFGWQLVLTVSLFQFPLSALIYLPLALRTIRICFFHLFRFKWYDKKNLPLLVRWHRGFLLHFKTVSIALSTFQYDKKNLPVLVRWNSGFLQQKFDEYAYCLSFDKRKGYTTAWQRFSKKRKKNIHGKR